MILLHRPLLPFLGFMLLNGNIPLHAEVLPAPLVALEAQGIQILEQFEVPGGLKAYAGIYNGQGIGLFLTPDNQHVVIGHLFDVKGNNLTEAPLDKQVYKPLSDAMWSRMEQSTWIVDGHENAAKIVYVFSDPNCPYCNKFWEEARPWVDSGKVQLRHIMVGILREDSMGKAAALLIDKQPAIALKTHEAQGKSSKLQPLTIIPKEIQKKLEENMSLMNELGAVATPAIYYQTPQGRLQEQVGLPQADELEGIMGSK